MRSRSSMRELGDVDALEQFLDGLGAHHGLEAGGAVLLVELAEAGLVLDDLALLDGRVAGIDDDVGLEVEHGFELAQADVEQVADARGQALEEPDVRAGRWPSSMWPRRSRRTLESVTSTPHLSQMTPRCFMRLYLPQRHSQSVMGPKMRAQNRPSRSGLKVR